MYKYFLLTLATMFLLTSVSNAQDSEDKQETAKNSEQSEEESPKDLLKRYQKQHSELKREIAKKSAEAQGKVIEEGGDQAAAMKAAMELQEEMSGELKTIDSKILKLGELADEDADTSLKAVTHVIQQSEDDELKSIAGDLLIKYHLENKKLERTIRRLTNGMPSKTTQELFEKIIANAEDDTLKGVTSLSLARYLTNVKQMAPMFESQPQIAEMYPELMEYFKSIKDDLTDESITNRLKEIGQNFEDVKYRNSTVGEIVAAEIKKIEIRARVAVGKVAPDIEGPDIDDVDFKLSDYRGKVVMLDFWGDW